MVELLAVSGGRARGLGRGRAPRRGAGGAGAALRGAPGQARGPVRP